MALGTLGLALLTATVLSADDGRTRPCKPGTPEAKQAHEALARMDGQLRALGPHDSTTQAVKGLMALVEQRCFEEAWVYFQLFERGNPASLKEWWSGGGQAWFRSMLELGAGSRTVLSPPDVRTGLVAKPGTALSSVVCPSDSPCPDSGRWKRLAQAAIDAKWKMKEEETKRWASRSEPRPVRADCLQRVKDAPLQTQYEALRQCWAETRVRMPTLPVGEIRLPRKGWLVMRGRRGHYDFCDEVRAYSMATGAAYLAQSCSGLALIEGGHVDPEKTDAARALNVRSGKVPVAALRDAAVMVLLMDLVDPTIQRKGERFTLPPNLEPVWAGSPRSGSVYGLLIGGHTGQTTIAWQISVPGRVETTGTFTWPDSFDPTEDVTADWVRKVEEQFKDGCPPEALPPGILGLSPTPDVNGRDAPDGVSHVQTSLEAQLAAYVPGCKPAPAR